MTMIRHRQTWTGRGMRLMRPITMLVLCLCGAQTQASEPLDCLIEPNLLVEISSSEVGVLGSVQVDAADVVRAGDVIAALRTDVERAALKLSLARADAVAEVELLRRDHAFNTRKRDRIDKLQGNLAVSVQNVDEVRTAEDLARLRLSAATEKQRTARLEAERDALALERRTVRSPVSGVVVKRYKSAGEYVDGDPIVQLVQLDPLRVQVVAPIAMFGQISVGMQATVLPELAIDGPFEASVTSIDPVMDAATATFGVRLSLPNPEHRLPPGLKCTLVLHARKERVVDTKPTHVPAPAAVVPAPLVGAKASIAAAQALPARVPAAKDHDWQSAAAQLAPALDAAPSPTPSPTLPTAATVVFQPAANLRANQCATLGPLASDVAAEAIAAALTASDVGFERRTTGGTNKVAATWIVLSDDADSSAANLLDRIGRADISDFQLLTRGNWKKRISYGTYRGKESAQRRVRALNARGFKAVLVDRTDGELKIWFDLTRAPTDSLLASIGATVRDKHPGITVRSIPCAQLASR